MLDRRRIATESAREWTGTWYSREKRGEEGLEESKRELFSLRRRGEEEAVEAKGDWDELERRKNDIIAEFWAVVVVVELGMFEGERMMEADGNGKEERAM